MSLKAQLTAAFLAMVGLSLGGATAVTYVMVQRSELRQLDLALLASAHDEAAEAALRGGDELSVGRGDGPVTDDLGPLATYAVLFESEGAILDRVGEAPHSLLPEGIPDVELGIPFDLHRGGDTLRAVVVRVPRGDRRLLLAAPRRYLDADLVRLANILGLVLVVALLASGILAVNVLGRLTRDHRAIAETARRVAAGDFKARVAIRGYGETAQLANDINEMNERIERLVEAQRRFIAHASHELRSPLTLLYGELTHALRRSRDIESYREAIEEAIDSTVRLKRLTDHLLALARLSASRVEGEVLDLLELARETVASRVGPEDRSRISVRGEAALVRGEATDLIQMIWNLAENAIRHSPPEGAIEITVGRVGDSVRLSVRDYGVGIAEEERGRIFEPFYRTSWTRSRHEGGTGLGLAIVRETARSLGGDVRLEPADPAQPGAHFVVDVPAA